MIWLHIVTALTAIAVALALIAIFVDNRIARRRIDCFDLCRVATAVSLSVGAVLHLSMLGWP